MFDSFFPFLLLLLESLTHDICNNKQSEFHPPKLNIKWVLHISNRGLFSQSWSRYCQLQIHRESLCTNYLLVYFSSQAHDLFSPTDLIQTLKWSHICLRGRNTLWQHLLAVEETDYSNFIFQSRFYSLLFFFFFWGCWGSSPEICTC